jgi:hypothetical protein
MRPGQVLCSGRSHISSGVCCLLCGGVCVDCSTDNVPAMSGWVIHIQQLTDGVHSMSGWDIHIARFKDSLCRMQGRDVWGEGCAVGVLSLRSRHVHVTDRADSVLALPAGRILIKHQPLGLHRLCHRRLRDRHWCLVAGRVHMVRCGHVRHSTRRNGVLPLPCRDLRHWRRRCSERQGSECFGSIGCSIPPTLQRSCGVGGMRLMQRVGSVRRGVATARRCLPRQCLRRRIPCRSPRCISKSIWRKYVGWKLCL